MFCPKQIEERLHADPMVWIRHESMALFCLCWNYFSNFPCLDACDMYFCIFGLINNNLFVLFYNLLSLLYTLIQPCIYIVIIWIIMKLLNLTNSVTPTLSSASHVIIFSSVKMDLIVGLVDLQKFESLGEYRKNWNIGCWIKNCSKLWRIKCNFSKNL